MSWHQPPSSKKRPAPSKCHPALPGASSFLFPAQRSGGQDRNVGVASSLLRHILASSRKRRAQAERKASRGGGQSPQIPIKLNITLMTYTKIQVVQGILKLSLMLGDSKHRQGVAQRCSSTLQGERRGCAAALRVPEPRLLASAGGRKHLITYGGPKHRGTQP